MSSPANPTERIFRAITTFVVLLVIATGCAPSSPSAPAQPQDSPNEPVVVEQLPLPPTAPSNAAGSCTAPTGCISSGRNGILGTRAFTWDSRHVLAGITFAGAPADGIYNGPQLIMVKTDGTAFPSGDGWKCLTCGVPATNALGIDNPLDVTYPEAFRDGRRIKFGRSVLDCGPVTVVDCDPRAATTHVYPIRSPFPASATGGTMRELRLHPDNEHLGWNQMFFTPDFGDATQFGVFGKMTFNASAAPPAYELSDVSFLLGKDLDKSGQFISVKGPGELQFDSPAGVIGEFRGFTSDGRSALGIGTQDSFNYDVFATDLQSGRSQRLSRDPAYTDPVSMSPDDKSLVLADGRVDNQTGYPGQNPAGTDGRMYFAGAGPGVPPLIDLAITSAIGNLYNNQYGLPPAPGVAPDDHTSGRRFFEPYLINVDESAGRDLHDGQLLNAGADTTPGNGSISDPLWNVGADPAWSPDGTAIAYYQLLVGPPACNTPTPPEPAPCPVSHEPGGRLSRLMIARLTDRMATPPQPQPQPVSDTVPWGLSYAAGSPVPPARPQVPAGTYTLAGRTGSATVVITHGPSPLPNQITEVVGVKVTYDRYSADGSNVIDGTEEGTQARGPLRYTWHEDLTFSGAHDGTRKTSEPTGFVVTSPGLGQPPIITGTLTTVLDGRTFTSPVTGS